MDKSIIEGNAVSYVKLALRATGIIDPYINEGDKTPSWDGELFVYKSENFSKQNLRDVIPVQVKGRQVDKYINHFQVEVADLINYKNKHNIIFFVVQMKENEHRIYCARLLLYDLEKLIKRAKNNKSVSIPLEIFPEKDTSKIKDMVIKYLDNAERQKQMLPGVLSVHDLQKTVKEATLTFELSLRSNFTNDDIVSSIMSQKPYIYYENSLGVEFPVDKIDNVENLTVGRHKKGPIVVDAKKFYDGYDVVTNIDGTIVKIDRNIWLTHKNDRLILNYEHKGTLKERFRMIDFILSMHNGDLLTIGQCKLPIATLKLDSHEKATLQSAFNFYTDIEKLFVKLGISKDLDIDGLNQNQMTSLYEFCQSEMYDKEVSLGIGNTGQGVLRLGNVNIFCYCIQTQSGNKVYSIFNDSVFKFRFIVEEQEVMASPYLLLASESVETIEQIDNINFNHMIDSIKEFGISDFTEEAHIQLLLKLLLYYDKTKHKTVLDASKSLAELLFNRNKSIINCINLYQAIKRYDRLSLAQIGALITIKDACKDLDIKLACSILIESKLESEMLLNSLEPAIKEQFLKYPLMNLFKNQWPDIDGCFKD